MKATTRETLEAWGATVCSCPPAGPYDGGCIPCAARAVLAELDREPAAPPGRPECTMCAADTGPHRPGTVVREESCGCVVHGVGLLTNPWHVHFCPLHAAAGAAAVTLSNLVRTLDDRELGYLPPANDARRLLNKLHAEWGGKLRELEQGR